MSRFFRDAKFQRFRKLTVCVTIHADSENILRSFHSGSGRDDWASYLEIVRQLREYGQVLTEHVGDVELSVDGEDINNCFIHDRDLSWLRASDYLVAEVTTPSLGVGYEIGRATEWGKPVLCLYRRTEGRSLSAMISGSNGVTLKQYQNLAELKEIFEQFLQSK
jgi:2'-deoxynucleoside 5'-phosphate N-hydrolase